ncbi:MAG: GGDEF domain-containing protein [Thermoanaerobaculia bacterium]
MSRKDLDRTIAFQRPKVVSGEPSDSQSCLIVLKGAEIGRDFRLRGSGLVIGRSPEVDIRLPDDQASREHARLDRTVDVQGPGPTYVLTDLESTNRTFVNSKPVDRVVLQTGDKIQIGDSVLKYVVLDQIEATFHAEIRNRITYDQLTGLLTKESLYLAFQMELERCLRYGLPISVLMMDLDFFKSVNDGHGHLMGSHVLAEVGRLIRETIRETDVSGRYGGEEFISYLTETAAAGAQLAAERIRTTIGTYPFTLDEVTIEVKISIGIATAPEHGTELRALVKAADEALYRAKETGRNKVCLAGESD